MLWIGITGPMGSGKSAVAAIVRELGFPVLDADEVVRHVLSPGGAAEAEIFRTFGLAVRGADGHLDRRALGREVFGDPAKLDRLERIIHPLVRKHVADQRRALERQNTAAGFYDVPLLFEKKMEDQFDHILVVSAPTEIRRQRLKVRTGLSDAEIEARWANQLSPEYKEARASAVIPNAGSLAELRQNVKAALLQLGLADRGS